MKSRPQGTWYRGIQKPHGIPARLHRYAIDLARQTKQPVYLLRRPTPIRLEILFEPPVTLFRVYQQILYLRYKSNRVDLIIDYNPKGI